MNLRTLFAAVLALTGLSAAATEPVKPASVTIMSYNIRYGDAKDGTNSWQYRAGATILMIEDQKPDIIGVQEALDYQMEVIKEYAQNYKGVGVGRENGKHEGEHMGIFYNTKTIKLVKWGTFWLSETPDKPSKGWDGACTRTATWAILKEKSSGKKFFFVNTHLDHVGVEARKNGLQLILDKIAAMNKEGLPLILSGDFNVRPGDPALSPLEGRMRSARDWAVKTDLGNTYNAWGHSEQAQTIDHIYASGFASCTIFEVIRKPYMERKFISDHFPVKATLIF